MVRRAQLTAIKYGAITLTNLQNQLAYIWDALNRVFFIILIMFIFVQLWTAAFEARGETVIGGLTLMDTIWYFLIAEVLELSKTRHDQTISEEVKDGSIAYTLGRPYNYLAYQYFHGMGETLIKMGVVFLFGMPIAFYYAGMPDVQVVHLPAVALVIILALVLDFFFHSMIGLLAFVIEDTGSFRIIYQKLVFILGGMLIPIDFLPDWLQSIARLLPFSLVAYAPAKLFVAFSWEQFGQIMVMMVFWLVVVGTLLWLQYRWATRRLTVNGG
jgi:ABC-2 type transport system permease protein